MFLHQIYRKNALVEVFFGKNDGLTQFNMKKSLNLSIYHFLLHQIKKMQSFFNYLQFILQKMAGINYDLLHLQKFLI
jgi:hypothetical protein